MLRKLLISLNDPIKEGFCELSQFSFLSIVSIHDILMANLCATLNYYILAMSW